MKFRTVHIIILLFTALQGKAQQDIPAYIMSRFTSYCNTVPREEIYIHTDRQEYAAGEDLWFGVRLFERRSGNLSDSSGIAYFELLNPESKPVIRKRILLSKGYGPGHALIPDTLRSGMYTIVAYTSWMRNFLPFNCFMKQIRIYNPAGRNAFVMSRLLPGLKMAGTSMIPPNPAIRFDADNRMPDSLRLTLVTTDEFRKENKETAYLFIQNRGRISRLTTEIIDAPVKKISVARHELLPGINQVTVFDSKGPACERFVYVPLPKKGGTTISAPDSCSRREKIILDIDAGKLNRDSSLNMSVSVSLTGGNDFPGMEDYLVFGSEFGIPPWTRIGGKRLTELPEAVMDSLMQTLVSNWINWERIFSTEEQYYRYPRENEHHYIMGKLLNDEMAQSAADEKVLLSFMGGEPAFRYTTTDTYGNFNMELEIDDVPREMIIQNDLTSLSYRPVLEPSFQNISISEGFTDTSAYNPGSLRVLRNHMIRKIYGSSSSVFGSENKKAASPGRFYGKPDFTLNMTEYITLDSIAEVFFELVPRVNLVYANRTFRMLVLDESGEKLEGVPFVMVDGILIRDAAIIARLNPDAVKKIDVVWDKYRIGNYIFNGIINIVLKDGFTEELMPPDAVKLSYSVLEPDPVFVSPEYPDENAASSTEADFRNTLYWNPSANTSATGKAQLEFTAPDNGGEFTITVQGVQASGKIVWGEKRIRVN